MFALISNTPQVYSKTVILFSTIDELLAHPLPSGHPRAVVIPDNTVQSSNSILAACDRAEREGKVVVL